MKFRPLSKRYQFDDTLSMNFLSHLHMPIANWLFDLLINKDLVVRPDGIYRHSPYLTNDFRETLQVNLRETFPSEWNEAIHKILETTDRTTMVMQWCLNYYADQRQANNLEWILSNGGSGYKVLKTDPEASEYTEGVYDLVERVPSPVMQTAKKALGTSSELMKAWQACYHRNPSYNETVQICQNVLESLLRDTYLPKDTKAQLGKLIIDIRNSKTLSYKGSNIPGVPNDLLSIIQNVPQYRGLHKAGTGKDAGKAEAEFILQATILIWNMHGSH